MELEIIELEKYFEDNPELQNIFTNFTEYMEIFNLMNINSFEYSFPTTSTLEGIENKKSFSTFI